MTTESYNFEISKVDSSQVELYFGEGALKDITSFSNAGAGKVTVTCPIAHGKADNDYVKIADGGFYDGVHQISDKTDLTFAITTPWEGTLSGAKWQDPTDLTGKTVAADIVKNLGDSKVLASWTISYPDASHGHARGVLLKAAKAHFPKGKVYCDFILTITATGWPDQVLRSEITVHEGATQG